MMGFSVSDATAGALLGPPNIFAAPWGKVQRIPADTNEM